MQPEMRFDGRVAIVTGAGRGLGRSHALALASRGARVIVNDTGAAIDGAGSGSHAEQVVREIRQQGGEAFANMADVTRADDMHALAAQAMERWGRIDVLVCNAGNLRDRTFAKMTLEDYQAVIAVHLTGAFNACKAVWEPMKAQGYGRIVLTTSSSGLFGNFGQSNYAAAKLGLIGLMNTLALEGARYGIRVNALAPVAATRMMDDLLADVRVRDLLAPEAASVGLLALCHEGAPDRAILCCGAGVYALARMVETEGVHIALEERSPERLAELWPRVASPSLPETPAAAGAQTDRFLAIALQSSRLTS